MKNPKQTFVAFGDSITLAAAQTPENRWCSILENRLNADGKSCSVINAGVGGNTSREGLARLEKDVLAHRPTTVLIEFGGNDATNDLARRVELKEFNENLDKILAGIRTVSATAVVLTFPPVIDEWHSIGKDAFFQKWGGFDRCVDEYRDAARKFAQKNNLKLADIDQAFRNAFQSQEAGTLILRDGVHLTDEGNRLLARTVCEIFEKE